MRQLKKSSPFRVLPYLYGAIIALTIFIDAFAIISPNVTDDVWNLIVLPPAYLLSALTILQGIFFLHLLHEAQKVMVEKGFSTVSPKHVVLAFFVPIYNLFMVPKFVSAIASAVNPGMTGIVGFWWVTRIVSSFVSRGVMAQEQITLGWSIVEVGSLSLTFYLAWRVITIVAEITTDEEELIEVFE